MSRSISRACIDAYGLPDQAVEALESVGLTDADVASDFAWLADHDAATLVDVCLDGTDPDDTATRSAWREYVAALVAARGAR
jgi:hypothetical protein